MNSLKPAMQEYVAETLCFVSATEFQDHCPHCKDGPCTMWQSFMREAAFAIQAVQDCTRLEMRKNPKRRDIKTLI